jgi:hypothetical protein
MEQLSHRVNARPHHRELMARMYWQKNSLPL